MESGREQNDEIKVIIIGDSGVGKTNLINTSIGINFLENNSTTVTSSFISKQFKIGDKKYNVNIWDTAGQENYRSITKLFFKGSEIVILVYDITNSKTFDSLDFWYSTCQEIIGNEAVYGVIGNKIDLFVEEQVLEEEARKFAEEKKMPFALVSAKDEPKGLEFFLKELIEEYYGLEDKDTKNESMKLDLKKEKVTEKKKNIVLDYLGEKF